MTVDTKAPLERHLDRLYRTLLETVRESFISSTETWPALLALIAVRMLAEHDTWNAAIHQPPPQYASALDGIAGHVEQQFPELQGVLRDTLLVPLRRLPVSSLADCLFSVASLSPAVLPDNSRTVFGSWFDAQINSSIMRSGSGASATPPSIARLMVELAAIPPSSCVLDPYCGVGTLLAAAAKTDGTVQLFGQELNQDAWALATLRLFLLGQNAAHIVIGDSVEHPAFADDGKLQQFDCVLCDAPMGMTMPARYDGLWQRFPFGQPGRGSMDNAFLQHAVQRMKPMGIAIALVSHGLLFRTGADARLREHLLEAGLIKAVIGLPAKLRAEAAIETALIIFGPAAPDQPILFIDVSRHHAPVRGRTELSDELVQQILDLSRSRRDQASVAKLVSLNEIRRNDFLLLPRRYVAAAPIITTKHDLRDLQAEIERLEREHDAAVEEMDQLLKEWLNPETEPKRRFRLE